MMYLKTEMNLNYVYSFFSYSSVNTILSRLQKPVG